MKTSSYPPFHQNIDRTSAWLGSRATVWKTTVYRSVQAEIALLICTDLQVFFFFFGAADRKEGPVEKGHVSGICERGRQKAGSLICSDLFLEQIGRKQSKSEQIRKNRGVPENKERKSEQIRRNRGNLNKSG